MSSQYDPNAYQMPVPMTLVDIAAGARRLQGAENAELLYPGLPEHDWRFVALLPSGATVTFRRDSTPTEIADYLRREGVDVDAIVEPGFEAA